MDVCKIREGWAEARVNGCFPAFAGSPAKVALVNVFSTTDVDFCLFQEGVRLVFYLRASVSLEWANGLVALESTEVSRVFVFWCRRNLPRISSITVSIAWSSIKRSLFSAAAFVAANCIVTGNDSLFNPIYCNELSPVIKEVGLWNTWLWDSLYSSPYNAYIIFCSRGKAESVKSLLDLSIIVCRTSSGTLNPRPLSLACHSRRQVKSDVSCNGILEEGTYMIGKQFVHSDTLLSRQS